MDQEIRNSNFELLRILSMCMIIVAHYAYHGGLIDEGTAANQGFAILLRIGGKLGVTCFVLIGAYFLTSKEFKMERIIRLFFETVFYSVIIYLLALASGGGTRKLVNVHSCFIRSHI